MQWMILKMKVFRWRSLEEKGLVSERNWVIPIQPAGKDWLKLQESPMW